MNPQIVMVTILELITNVKVFDQVYATTVGGPANASRVIMMYLTIPPFNGSSSAKHR